MTEKQYPSLPEQGNNLAKFSFDLIKNALHGGALNSSVEVQSERLEICKTCDFYDGIQVRCKECGCFLHPKVSFALSTCNIGKWSEDRSTWENEKFEGIMKKTEEEQQ